MKKQITSTWPEQKKVFIQKILWSENKKEFLE